jgi:hypothetical protein
MGNKKSPHPEWALAHKQKNTELRCLGGKYYLYAISSRWDKERKRTVKVTGKLLGRITETDGFIESEKAKLRRQQAVIKSISVKESGFYSFLKEHFGEQLSLLEKHFPEHWKQLVAMVYGRLLHQSPLKNMFFHYSHSLMSEEFPATNISPKSISKTLRELGYKREQIVAYFKEFSSSEDCILFDGTDIFSCSEKR